MGLNLTRCNSAASAREGPSTGRPSTALVRRGGRVQAGKEWLARHEVLVSVVGVHFRPPRGMQILTTCCHTPPHIYIYIYYIFLFIFLIRALETALGSGKSHNRNGTVLASDRSPRDRGKSHGRMA